MLKYTISRNLTTSIDISWKELVHQPQCLVNLVFFVNGQWVKSAWSENEEEVEIETEQETFNLMVQAYFLNGTNPLCYQANHAIVIDRETESEAGVKEELEAVPVDVGGVAALVVALLLLSLLGLATFFIVRMKRKEMEK